MLCIGSGLLVRPVSKAHYLLCGSGSMVHRLYHEFVSLSWLYRLGWISWMSGSLACFSVLW
uniref:Uncharacterized protein n=1 Tax=Picea glauca TaxID=3330 RepID=A0A117NJ42_PICGL|nr:hypothetical protein ABT39_MTgene819 [Picea glauca]QHR87167.1 hypothetical protein Q903MT_gene1176 [Picea sitchensis]